MQVKGEHENGQSRKVVELTFEVCALSFEWMVCPARVVRISSSDSTKHTTAYQQVQHE